VQRGSFGLKPQAPVYTNSSVTKVPSANLSQIVLNPFESLPNVTGGPSTWQATSTVSLTILPLGFSSPGVKKVLRLRQPKSENLTASLPMVKTIMKIITIERILVINMIVREVQQGTRNVQYVKVLVKTQKCKV
jgi:hypothetical protein